MKENINETFLYLAMAALTGLRQLHERKTRVECIALEHLDGRNSRQKRLRGRCG